MGTMQHELLAGQVRVGGAGDHAGTNITTYYYYYYYYYYYTILRYYYNIPLLYSNTTILLYTRNRMKWKSEI